MLREARPGGQSCPPTPCQRREIPAAFPSLARQKGMRVRGRDHGASSRDGRGRDMRQSARQGGVEGAQAAHLREVAQQAEGDGARAAAHLQDEGAALGSYHTGPLGHLLQHPFNQFLQGRQIWIRAGANVAPRGLGTETRARLAPVWLQKWGWLKPD